MFVLEIREEAQNLQQDRKRIIEKQLKQQEREAKNSRKNYPMDYGTEYGPYSKAR